MMCQVTCANIELGAFVGFTAHLHDDDIEFC